MKRVGVVLSIFTLLTSFISGCQPSFQPGAYTDDLNRSVVINEAPERIVTYGPSITEILFALGQDDKVVGVDSLSNYPEAARAKPKVGDAFTPSIERVVDLKPDIVLTLKQQQLNTNLDNLGIKYLVIDPKDIDGIYRNILLIGKITGSEAKAEALVGEMKKNAAAVQNRVSRAPKVRTIFLVDTTDLNSPWTAGPGSFIDSLITMAGGINVAANASSPWTQLSIEQIIHTDPEVVILPDQYAVSPQALREHPAWQKISAVRNNRVFVVNGDIVSRSGPRIAQGLQEVAKIIHPELYK